MLALTADRKKLMKQFPNLVDYESKLLFRHFYDPKPLPADGAEDRRRGPQMLTGVRRTRRADLSALQRRRPGAPPHPHRHPQDAEHLVDGPFWRTYLETLGIQKRNVVFSDDTTEEMWPRAANTARSILLPLQGRAGAHPQPALPPPQDEKPLRYIFNPMLTTSPRS